MARDRQQRGTATRWNFSRVGAIAAVVAIVAMTMPFRSIPIGSSPSFMPTFLTVIFCASALTAFMLFQQFRSNGRPVLLAAGLAYLFSSLSIIPHALTFPGVITAEGLFTTSASNASWLWTLWHVGFPVVMALGIVIAPKCLARDVCRTRAVALGSILVATVVAALTALIVLGHAWIPEAIRDGNYGSLLYVHGWWIIGLSLVATIGVHIRLRNESALERWLVVAFVIGIADIVLTLFAGSRFTVGWYVARGLSAVGSGVLLTVLIAEISTLYRRAENDKRALEDEALALLSEKRNAQYREDRVRKILHNAADGYIEVSRSGKIQGWNAKSADMFGWTADEVTDQNAALLLSVPENQDYTLSALDTLWGYEGRFVGVHVEFTLKHRAGHSFPVEMTAWVDESGFEPRMCAFVRDITQRRDAELKMQHALEDERRAVLRLQEIDKAKSDFVSSISHELRSPLTSTLGYLEILADGGAGELSEEQSRMVAIADRNAKRLKSLIEDLLTLSSIEQGSFGISFRPVDIGPVIAQAVAANAAFANERGIKLTVDIDDHLGMCPGDETQIMRAVSNVVNNAVKFTPPTGRIDVRVSSRDGHVVVQVIDDGIGVPAHEQPRLFQRFFRSQIAIEQQHQGAGLGLTITKALVDHHGGRIDFDSEMGKGTDIRLHLPVVPVAAD